MRSTTIRDLLAVQPVLVGLEAGDVDLMAGCGRNRVAESTRDARADGKWEQDEGERPGEDSRCRYQLRAAVGPVAWR